MSHINSLSEDFLIMLPSVMITVLGCLGWWIFCHWFVAWKSPADIRGCHNYKENSLLTIDERILINRTLLKAALKGTQADRLFFAGLAFAFLAVLLVIAVRFIFP